MSAIFDVIVIGGGPAGTAAAIECRRRGLSTLVLEALQPPRYIPGETLHPGAGPLFRWLGIEEEIAAADFWRQPGHFVRYLKQSHFVSYGADERGPWLGYQADRLQLRQILLNRARQCGVVIPQDAIAVQPITNAGQVCGVATSSGAISAAFTIDATGQSHWLQSHLGLPVLRVSPTLTARYGWVECATNWLSNETVPEFRVQAGCWSWVAPVRRDRFAWVRLDLHSGLARPPMFLPRLPGERSVGASRARDVSWKIVLPCAGRGYFLAGDAACVLDPASSDGVIRAMRSGLLAAEAIAKILDGTVAPSLAEAGYRAWVAHTFCREAGALLKFYAQLENAPSWLPSAAASVRYISTSRFS